MKKISEIESTVRIGKYGITEGVIKEIKNQLKKRKIIKIKFLKSTKSIASLEEFVEILEKKTGAEVLDVRGGTVVLALRREDED